MSIIDRTYFTFGTTLIPNISAAKIQAPVIASSNQDDLDRAISIYEEEYLRLVLGDLFDEFNETEQKWIDLIGVLRDSTLKRSPIANYVFYKYFPLFCTTRTGAGDTSNGEIRRAQITAWNDAIGMNERVILYLYENAATYEHDDVYLDFDKMSTLLNIDSFIA